MFLLRKLSGRGSSTIRQGNPHISSHEEDDISKQALDQASEYVSEGDYEEALWILERLGQLDPAVKGLAELVAVAEVCNAAILRSCACTRENRIPDWYKILKVDEKSELIAIKKRYRHLALLLHPDKNKHEKAEAAFKLASEAYACLSDKKRREIYNVKKSFIKCKHCSARDCATSGSDRWPGYHVLREKTSLRRPGSFPDLTQTDWILDQERLRMFRARARARVFGNLEKAWKERGFTGLEKTNIVKEGFERNPKGEVRMSHNHHERKTRTSETNRMKEETQKDRFAVVGDRDLGALGNMMDANKQKVSDQQLYQPCRNLGVLIRDLQTELILSTESEDYQSDEEDDIETQKPTPVNVLRPDARDLETHGNGGLGAMSGPHIQVGRQNPSSSADGHICPDGLHDLGWPAFGNAATGSNANASKQRVDKGFLHKNRRERDSKLEKPETAMVMDCQPVQESEETDFIRSARQDEDCAGTVLRKHKLFRQTHRNDSLDMEETILRSQREKSEQLLKTLQRLREETKTVAASLNHL